MKTHKLIVIALTALFLFSLNALAGESSKNNPAGSNSDELYFGQKPPGEKAEIFAPEVMKYEPHDSPVILENENLMIVGAMEVGIKFYRMTDGKLSPVSNPLGFDVPAICQGMAVSPALDRLYIRDWNDRDPYFYFIDKTEDGWTAPKKLSDEVNSIDTHWQFTIADNENLYFLSRSQGIVVAVFDGKTHLKPVPLKLEDGSNMQGGSPYISPDESYILFAMDNDLYISYNMKNGQWTTPKNLGPEINSGYMDNCPRISPNGKYLFFTSRKNGPDWVLCWADASFVEKLRPEFLK